MKRLIAILCLFAVPAWANFWTRTNDINGLTLHPATLTGAVGVIRLGVLALDGPSPRDLSGSWIRMDVTAMQDGYTTSYLGTVESVAGVARGLGSLEAGTNIVRLLAVPTDNPENAYPLAWETIVLTSAPSAGASVSLVVSNTTLINNPIVGGNFGSTGGTVAITQSGSNFNFEASSGAGAIYGTDRTNAPRVFTNLATGSGLSAVLTNGTMTLNLDGANYPYSGVSYTNISYYFNNGTNVVYAQAPAGATWMVFGMNAAGAGGNASGAGGWTGGRMPVRAYEWFTVCVGEKGVIVTNSAPGVATWTPSAWPGGGRGATRSSASAYGSGGYAAIFRGQNMAVTGLVAIASSGSGQNASRSGGAGGGVVGAVGYPGNASGNAGGYNSNGVPPATVSTSAWTISGVAMVLTGSPPAQLQGGDAYLATNATVGAGGGSPGFFSGSGGAGVGALDGSPGASGCGWFNEAMGVIGDTVRGIGTTTPKKEIPEYVNAGGTYGDAGYNGLVWIGWVYE